MKDNMPTWLRNIVAIITKRFTINGECDPMYIANVIASMNGMGDGGGNFYDQRKPISKETAERLQFAYSSLIEKDEIDELYDILRTGKMNEQKAEKGICRKISKWLNEINSPDAWRKRYLSQCIEEARRTLLEFS